MIGIDCDFPGGNIVVESIGRDIVMLRPDRRDTEGFWFYWHFRVRGAAGRRLTFRFTDGEPVGVRGPAVSFDHGAGWRWLGAGQATASSFAFDFPGHADDVRFSCGMPCTETNWQAFLQRLAGRSAIGDAELCRSRKGRRVEMLFCGRRDGNASTRVAVTCRHHCCEMMAGYALEGLAEAVLADPSCRRLREETEFLFVPFVDKDGVEDGDQGKNRRPRDHGRDYDDPQLYPETSAIRALLPAWGDGKLRAAVDLHCPYIRGPWNEHIYQVGQQQPRVWAEQQRFGRLLESCRRGPLPYRADGDLPFGRGWNTAANYAGGMSFSRWAAGLPGVRLATSIELPYADASGAEVNAATARAFGRDLAEALACHLAGREA